MTQNTIYDYLGNDNDPLYQKIRQLNKGDVVALDDAEVSLNIHGIYEVSTEEYHEPFSDLNSCYEFVCDLLGEKLLGS